VRISYTARYVQTWGSKGPSTKFVHLELPFVGGCPLRKDVQDERGAVAHADRSLRAQHLVKYARQGALLPLQSGRHLTRYMLDVGVSEYVGMPIQQDLWPVHTVHPYGI
jgi:hypothetical protein